MRQNHNKASLAIHAFVDNLDNAHYDCDDAKLEYNLGEIIQNSFFSNVDIVIVWDDIFSVQAAKRKSSNSFAIVIKTPNLPEIGKVDDFIEDSKVSIPVIKELAKIVSYIEENQESIDSGDNMTDYEKEKKYNQKDFFEKAYMVGVQKMKKYLTRLEEEILGLTQKMENSGLASRRSTYKMAIEKLKSDAIGEDDKKFASKFYKLVEEDYPDFKKLLNFDNKKRLESRVRQFYKKVFSKFQFA